MEEFLLLGQVPGTNMVINFWQWTLVFGALLVLVGLRIEFRRYRQWRHDLAATQLLMSKRVDATILDQAV